MTKPEIEQLFENNFNCYADNKSDENILAMTKDKFVEVVSNLVEAPVSPILANKELQPRKGAIAFCSLNRLGLITSETPIEVTYNDGNKGTSWIGIQLTDGEVNGVGGDNGKIIQQKAGDPWMARKPKVIAYLDDIVS
jgi:hypothetical protein